jgi:hypothetical protein
MLQNYKITISHMQKKVTLRRDVIDEKDSTGEVAGVPYLKIPHRPIRSTAG